MPYDTVRVKDFTKLPGEVDDTLRIRRAVDAFLIELRNRTSAVLDFGVGDYLSHHIPFRQPGDAALFGRIVGDGPEACVIRGYSGERTMTITNPNVMEIGGFKLSGGPAKTNSLDHAGLVLSNVGSGVGHGCNVHDIRTEHYGVGLSLGDYVTGGAAAEMLVSNYGANQCHFGSAGFGLNTLNNTFLNMELNECDNGVYSDSAYGWNFYGGSLGNNGCSFNFRCGGEVIIEGMRDEWGPKTGEGGFIQYGASTSIRLHVRGCQVLDQVKGRTILEAIKPVAGETSLLLSGSFITGQASASKLVYLIGNSFVTGEPKPYRGTPTDVEVRGCVRADRASGAAIADFPRETGPGGSTPPPPPPPGTVAVYKAILSKVGAPPTVKGTSGQMDVSVTNISNVALGSGDKITYMWLKGTAPTGQYGDRWAIPNLPIGATWAGKMTVFTPPAAGSYVLRVMLVHEPSTWFGSLDIPVTVT